MLTRIYIRNYAIIHELDLSIEQGLSVITGETGAGKSILLGALGLALGKRADTRVLPDDSLKCIVEAYFRLNKNELKELFDREGLDHDQTMICRREISGGGKSRSFINDTPVQLKVLQEFTSHLIELHQQHDNLALQTKEYQVKALDTLSNASPLHTEYRALYNRLSREKAELARIRELEITSSRKKDFLLFQLKELEQAQLKAGEIEALEESQNLLRHAEDIDHALEQLQATLNHGPHAINQQLISLGKQIDIVRKVSAPLSVIGDRIDALRVEVQDLAMEAGRIEGSGHQDAQHLTRVETRLSQLYNLLKKYQVANDNSLIDLYKSLQTELNELTSVGDTVLILEKQIQETNLVLTVTGTKLSAKRKAGAKKIMPEMNALLQELGMPNAKFAIEVLDQQDPVHDGMDEINFLFSANKGMQMQKLHVIASGGELSRLSLALKSLYAAQAQLPTIIFDEIDTGISGEVAWRMGQLIRTLAQGHQILMISHSPQIAAHAATQYHVSKVVVNGKDTSSIQLLTKDLRLVEIAKMLSGDPPSKEAMANAKSLVSAIKN